MAEVQEAPTPIKSMGIMGLLHWNTIFILGALFIILYIINFATVDLTSKGAGVSMILIIMSVALLVTSADFFIEGAKGLARRAGIAEVVIGLTIVSIGTSLPEILVTSTASYEAKTSGSVLSELAIGNIYGSVLVQITLILGIVVLFRPLDVRPAWLKRDGLLMLLAVLLLSLFIGTGRTLTQLEGLILILVYALYLSYLLRNKDKIRTEEAEIIDDVKGTSEISWTGGAYLVMVVVGLALAIYASNQLIMAASDIAYKLNVPHAVIGSTVSGLGTSLPELTVALMASKRSQGVAIGTLIGSNITDPLLSIGIGALINPMSISPEAWFLTLWIIIPATLGGVIWCIVFMWTGFKFNRKEGIGLIAFYAVFLLALYLEHIGIIGPT